MALSGGGARGFAHIGMLKVIDEVGLPVDMVAGTSIGAVVGGLYCMGYSAVQIESLAVALQWKNIFDDRLNRSELSVSQKRWAPYGNYRFNIDKKLIPSLPSGFVPGQKIDMELFSLFYPASQIDNFDDLPIPFRCVATNLINGEEKVFSDGSLMEAVRASMSIPSIFQPFELDGQLYIDGGISQNLPTQVLSNMGATECIGLKVNSKLRDKEDIHDIIDVLDQTINIGITKKVSQSVDNCAILIEPDLSDFSAMDFDKIELIIAAGEAAARARLPELRRLAEERRHYPSQLRALPSLPAVWNFRKVFIEGNQYLSASKVREYTNLREDIPYTKEQITNGLREASRTELFDQIYPNIIGRENFPVLQIRVKEKVRQIGALNLSYNQDDKLMAGVVFSFTNVVQKNSNLLAEIKVGGKHELNVDYAKNFGNRYGGYFRIFPYINEKRIYFYNNLHEKEMSVRSLEYGGTFGIGMFARKIVALEGYTFSYNTRLYRDISIQDMDYHAFTSSGVGVKILHESLDDYTFPMKGARLLSKFSVADDRWMSDATYKKFKTDFMFAFPLLNHVSTIYGFEYGSYFDAKNVVNVDPFYIGGMDSYPGYHNSEKSAPFYKINTLMVRAEPFRNFFISSEIAGLNYADSDIWTPFRNLILCGGMEIGYRSVLGPLRAGMGIKEGSSMNYFLSLGYDHDIFDFSRR